MPLARDALRIGTGTRKRCKWDGVTEDSNSRKVRILRIESDSVNATVGRKIRVNGMALEPIWTPLIPATFPEDKVASFEADVPMQRAGQPEEVAPCYIFPASDNASYMPGQIFHPNGGEVVNG